MSEVIIGGTGASQKKPFSHRAHSKNQAKKAIPRRKHQQWFLKDNCDLSIEVEDMNTPGREGS